ncbi:Probable Co/Zn/Cd efflux system membrane fusion protein [hydrothermal vent metagenome]|uniref:Probable Co/Zn/Cd efflux system membrane fusion protein n=1 Tax=hydrothermal vent metagenome TaxID=652676 RepID=A0A3B0UZI6_9ZZZZ
MNRPAEGKKPLIYIILILIGIIAGGLLVYIFQGALKPAVTAQVAAQGGQKTETAKERKIKYWQAPMNPGYIRNEPGKSPMGMDLIPVYEEEGDDSNVAGLVRIDPVTAQNIGVRTARAKITQLTKTITTVGRVAYDEKRVYRVNTKIEGWVNKLFVDFTGQKVHKGDKLLEVYSPTLVTTQEEYLLAKNFQENSGADAEPGDLSVLNLARKRLEFLDVPQHQIKELEETGKIKKYIHIHSPASGVVVKKNVIEGMFIKPGMALYTIADLRKVWVYADIYEYELPWIKTGEKADMTLTSYPGMLFKGKVSFIYPFMEAKTRTVKVRLEFDNPTGMLKPDMFANVMLKSRRAKKSVVVPSEAVILSGTRNIVLVTRGKGKFIPKEVTLGVEADGYYEIKDGISGGEEVVTSAQFLIDSESKLKEAISKMLEPKSEADGGGETKKKGQKDMQHEGMNMDDKSMKMDHSGMQMNMDDKDMKMDHSGMQMNMDDKSMKMDHSGMQMDMDNKDMKMDHSGMQMDMDDKGMKMDHSGMQMDMDDKGMKMDQKEMDHSGMKIDSE